MDITPNQLGASVDITDDAMYVLDLIADAIGRDEAAVIHGLLDLAAERRRREAARASVERPGVDLLADERLEGAEIGVEAARELLVALLDRSDRVTVELPESACRRYAGELVAAADQTMTAEWSRLREFPRQQDRRAA